MDEIKTDSGAEHRFRLGFRDAPLSMRLFVWGMSVVYASLILIYGHGITVLLVMGILMLLLPVLWELQIYRIRKKSYILLTAEEITVKVSGRKAIRYPVDKVERVETVDFDTDPNAPDNSHYRLPLTFGRGGDDIVPNRGVLLYLNRAYIKSVIPIFLWPSDPALFARTLENQIKRH